ncbi:MAG: 3-phosphoshikimate 1-carboxyvinyltransferase [Phycisphaeraceae bacterium]|nr:3-phosphoshikimate 1-carboxyvinyltransferase [Phycisphaeraceae bacterium]
MSDPILIEPVKPFDLKLSPPGSKSLTNRALLIAALADGPTTLDGVLFADDTRRMLEALQTLGFKLDIDEDAKRVTVTGRGGNFPVKEAELHLGNAGTAMRFLTAACCLGQGTYTLDGIPRMRERPIGELVEPLKQLGAEIDYLGEEGFPPLCINDSPYFEGGFLTLKPTLSSQFISALLIAGPCTPRGVTITFDGRVTSLPYIKMTLKLMKHFGVGHEWGGPKKNAVRVTAADYQAKAYTIEPDASNASYFLAAAASVPGSSVTIENLGGESVQGDADFCMVLGLMGCNVDQRTHSTTISAPTSGRLKGVDVKLNQMPDMAQTLAALAILAEGPTSIRKVGTLRVKETDRMEAIRVELTKLGAKVEIEGDDIHITPPAGNVITPASVDTYDDHRMAMAFSVIGLATPPGTVTINDPDCVNKTYPNYWDDLQKLHDAATATA